jgi:uncharacterized protein (DUF58 family)
LLFAFLLAAVGIVAILHTWRNLVDIEALVERPSPVFAGDDLAFPVELHERTGRERPRLRLAIRGSSDAVADLGPNATARTLLHLPAHRRGVVRLGRIRLFTVYPLGLLRAWCYLESASEALVYPRPGPRTGAWQELNYLRSDQGDRGVGADDFVGLRRYRPGDPPTHLDWKAVARERGLVTRQFGGDRAEQVWFDWNALEGRDAEDRLSRLCRAVVDAASQELRYGLRIPGQRIPPGSGDAHKHHCLAALARYQTEPA